MKLCIIKSGTGDEWTFGHGRRLKTDAKIDDTIKSPKKRKDLYGITQNEVNEEQMKTEESNANWSPVHHTPSLRQKKLRQHKTS